MFFANNFITLKPMYEIAEKKMTVKGTSVYQNYIDGTAENGNKTPQKYHFNRLQC